MKKAVCKQVNIGPGTSSSTTDLERIVGRERDVESYAEVVLDPEDVKFDEER